MVTLHKLRLSHASGATAEVYPHGAHVTSWVPAGGREALFLSRAAAFAPDKAIRGGVPVIFPQFAGLGPLPKHGFARTQPWERVDDDRPNAVRLRLRDSDTTRRVWPHAFLAELAVEIGADWLSISLMIHNPGNAPFEFTAALHTYLRVGDVRRAAVDGLRGLRYRVTGEQERVDEEDSIEVRGPVDRVYLNTPPELRVQDAENGRVFVLRSEGFADTVVWNPWAEATAALPDMENDEYLEMLCVEAAQAGAPVRLQAGAGWSGSQRIQLLDAPPPHAGTSSSQGAPDIPA